MLITVYFTEISIYDHNDHHELILYVTNYSLFLLPLFFPFSCNVESANFFTELLKKWIRYNTIRFILLGKRLFWIFYTFVLQNCKVVFSIFLIFQISWQFNSLYKAELLSTDHQGGIAQMVERSLSMREAPGSIPGTSMYLF